jgi:hypothetical protein
MPLPRSTWLSLAETVVFVVEAAGEPIDAVQAALIDAALAATITATGCLHLSTSPNLARYFAHPVLSNRQTVPASMWGAAIDWQRSRVGRYDLVRFERAQIERWLSTAEPEPGLQHEEPTGPGSPPTGSATAFATKYIADCQAADCRVTKAGLLSAWQAAGGKGHRDALRKAFDDAMGEEAPTRGRPRKSPK